MNKYTVYDDEYGEVYEPEPNPYPYVGETRFFQEDDGSWHEYEFTEEGCWIG